MLRVFLKSEQSSSNSPVVHGYHIKTIMLWACELYSLSTWNSECLISMCTRVIQTMIRWLKSSEFPHYFVTDCNLCDSVRIELQKEHERFVSKLYHLTNQKLSEWFIEN
jgi:hypothetical protein